MSIHQEIEFIRRRIAELQEELKVLEECEKDDSRANGDGRIKAEGLSLLR